MSTADTSGHGWTERDSKAFLDKGEIFVPGRREQIRAVTDLVPEPDGAGTVLDLACGEGLLGRAILRRYPDVRVIAVDASAEMRAAARRTNVAAGERFDCRPGRLEEIEPEHLGPFEAIVSSLAIHHLDADGKKELFARCHRALKPGGALLIADIVEPAGEAARRLAARAWDEEVERRARKVGDPEAHRRFRDEGWNHFALETPDPVDRPSPIADQLDWLREAGFDRPDVFWMRAGHAVYGAFRD